jgi:hypothetical protein
MLLSSKKDNKKLKIYFLEQCSTQKREGCEQRSRQHGKEGREPRSAADEGIVWKELVE